MSPLNLHYNKCKYLLIHTKTCKYRLDTCHNTYHNIIGLDPLVEFSINCVSIHVNICTIHMIEFPPPILEPFCPLFILIAQMGLIFSDGVSFCPEYHHQPLFFIRLSHTPFGICRYMKHPNPTQLHQLS